MVKGLGLFREHFAGFTDQYLLIGGTACSLAMEDVGLEFRATKINGGHSPILQHLRK